MIDFGDFPLVLLFFLLPVHPFLGFLLSVELRVCHILSSAHYHGVLLLQTVHLDPLSSGYCVVILAVVWKKAYRITNCEPWKNELSVGKTVLLTFISRTVLSSRCIVAGCCCPLHETVVSLVTMAGGW